MKKIGEKVDPSVLLFMMKRKRIHLHRAIKVSLQKIIKKTTV